MKVFLAKQQKWREHHGLMFFALDGGARGRCSNLHVVKNYIAFLSSIQMIKSVPAQFDEKRQVGKDDAVHRKLSTRGRIDSKYRGNGHEEWIWFDSKLIKW